MKKYRIIFIIILAFTLFSGVSLSHTTIFESNIPEIGQETPGVIDSWTEKLMGDTLMQQIEGSDLILQDYVVNEYLGGLGGLIQQHSGIEHFKLHFFGIDSPQPNAFAFFGGHVAVHSGLILVVGCESELAAVLAHETAHIAQRHLARILNSNKKLMPITLAEIIAACVIGALGSPEAGMHLVNAALGGHVQQLINFTRDHEYEADRIGIQILSEAGFDPKAMPAIFQRLNKQTQFINQPPEYLQTHPVFVARIADAENRALSMHYQPKPDSLFFNLIRVRLATLPSDRKNTEWALLKDKLKIGKNKDKEQNIAERYGKALLLQKKQKYAEAYSIMQSLIQEDPHWVLRLGLYEIEFEMGRKSEALEHIRSLYEAHPNNFAIGINYAKWLVDSKSPALAIDVLTDLRKATPKQPVIYDLLARAFSQLSRKSDVHIAKAEWHVLRGEFPLAFSQLDFALEDKQAPKETIKYIKARKIALKNLEKKQKALKL